MRVVAEIILSKEDRVLFLCTMPPFNKPVRFQPISQRFGLHPRKAVIAVARRPGGLQEGASEDGQHDWSDTDAGIAPRDGF